ncbi:MAG: hypothetical protein U0234_02005 [Sandaracinus sp.]
MRSISTVLAALSLFGVLGLGCARNGVAGEACSAPGLPSDALGQCASGFACAPDRSGQQGNGQSPHWDSATCREICSSDIECPDGTRCIGVTGAEYIMACQPTN